MFENFVKQHKLSLPHEVCLPQHFVLLPVYAHSTCYGLVPSENLQQGFQLEEYSNQSPVFGPMSGSAQQHAENIE